MSTTNPSLTSTSYSVLGLLSIRTWTAYELAQQVERSLGWFWPRTPRKIFDEPKKLVAAGLATAVDEPTGQRPRTIYTITETGRHALMVWLDAPSLAPKFESEAIVRTFFADGGTVEQLRTTLRSAAEAAEERHRAITAIFEAMEDDDYPFTTRRHINAIALRHGLDQQASHASWARWALTQVDSWTSTSDPGDWDWRSARP